MSQQLRAPPKKKPAAMMRPDYDTPPPVRGAPMQNYRASRVQSDGVLIAPPDRRAERAAMREKQAAIFAAAARLNERARIAATGGQSAPSYLERTAPDLPVSLLAQVFFSGANEEILRDGIGAGVYQLCLQPGHVGPPFLLPPLDAMSLHAGMRYVYAEHQFDTLPAGGELIRDQVQVLNEWLWRAMVPGLYSAACQQYHFMTHFEERIPTTVITVATDREFKDDADPRTLLLR